MTAVSQSQSWKLRLLDQRIAVEEAASRAAVWRAALMVAAACGIVLLVLRLGKLDEPWKLFVPALASAFIPSGLAPFRERAARQRTIRDLRELRDRYVLAMEEEAPASQVAYLDKRLEKLTQ